MISRTNFNQLKKTDLKQIFIICVILILVSFNHSLLRCIKLTSIITIPEVGSEILSFFKLWGLVPAIFLFSSLYLYLVKRLKYKQVFCTMVSIFLLFFVSFLLILYPNSANIEFTYAQVLAEQFLPPGFKNFGLMIRYWHLSLFFIFSELWGTVVLSVLVWGLINESFDFSRAKYLYPIFLLSSNVAGILGGKITQGLTLQKPLQHFPYFSAAWEQSLTIQLFIVILLCVLIIMLFLNLQNLSKKYKADNIEPGHSNTKQEGLIEAFTLCAKQPILLCIAILVLSYNLIYNIFEIIWIHQIKLVHAEPISFNIYMGGISANVGIFATAASILSIFLSKIDITRWVTTALVPPLVCLFTTLLFLLSSYNVLGPTAASTTLLFASTHIILGRVCKYTAFDQTKEAAFIPLARNIQRKGKAVVDLIAFKFGQFISNILVQLFLLFFPSLIYILPYLLGIIIITTLAWVMAVLKLWKLLQGKQVTEQVVDDNIRVSFKPREVEEA